MPRKVEAIVEKDGSIRLLEDVELHAGHRAIVTILDEDNVVDETTLLSQDSLAADWDRKEEDKAWAHLQG